MDEKISQVGQRIFALRKQQNLTREMLAEKADISVQFLADIEKGRKNMTITTLRKISAALFATTDYIVNGSKEKTDETECELIDLCKSLSPKLQAKAIKLLKVYLEVVSSE